MRISLGNLIIGVLCPFAAYSLAKCADVNIGIEVPLFAVAGLLAAYVVVTLTDWLLWKPIGKEHAELGNIIRQWELTTRTALGSPSHNRSPRGWWRPLWEWWHKRR